MNLELKNIEIFESLSEETIAFTADLFVNNTKLAHVNNKGSGGNSIYQLYQIDDRPLLLQTEAYCKNLPPEVYPSRIFPGETIKVPMNLETYIDNLLEDHLQKKYLDIFHKEIAKHQTDSILFGIPDQTYTRLRLAKPIAEIVRFSKGAEAIQTIIQERILPYLKKDEIILNTNLPPALMNVKRKHLQKPLQVPDNKSIKQQGRLR